MITVPKNIPFYIVKVIICGIISVKMNKRKYIIIYWIVETDEGGLPIEFKACNDLT